MSPPDKSQPSNSFEDLSKEDQPSLFQELYHFIVENKKWWMIPIVAVLGLVGLLVVFGSTGAAPFIYTLF